MQIINKLTMLYLPVGNMGKAKEFYNDKLGLKLVQDYRQDDNNWWVSLTLPKAESVLLFLRITER